MLECCSVRAAASGKLLDEEHAIPLDMIFVRPDGTIGRIAANTVPHSLEQVAFGEPAAAVLEIAGGARSAARYPRRAIM
jgi:uncharacterized membrane protein (UPF0127 family)